MKPRSPAIRMRLGERCGLALLIFGLASHSPSQGQPRDPAALVKEAAGLGTTRSEGGRAAAQPATKRGGRYARFSDGPRRVPRPSGASLRRARALGLGSIDAARQLLRRGPLTEWVAAARGRRPRRLLWPVEGGRFGRGFGRTRKRRRHIPHRGIDVAAPEGAVIRAAADGIVAYSDNGIRGFGNLVLIVHPGGWTTIYAHNYRNTVQAGWRVRRGERIGYVGATGIARGPHLHFELRIEGRPRDPAPWLDDMPTRADPRPRPQEGYQTPSVPQAQASSAGHYDEATPAR